ncbi:nucleotide exchange factor GrpE [Bradymonas sediminis]|uniref:nucleotide exchange factor GrpE n=1 Tax=Bradymonas sediminis TaxID=1548548 RepID=UPI0010EB91AE|nr:nucleotide exchange factor GrpE [Bradymonas sediminis]TDP75902.1 molecular chaperone GrpE [Bradymonas sediminis]
MFETLFFFVLIAAGVLGWLAYQGRQNAAHLRALSRQKFDELSGEHDKYVGRLRRKLVDANTFGHLDFAADLLPVLDALDMAAASAEQAGAGGVDDALRDGLKLVRQEFDTVLKQHGIVRCAPEAGTAFDPNLHEAVAVVAQENEEAQRVAPGHIVECLRPGYGHKDRVLRAAAVSVAAPENHSK